MSGEWMTPAEVEAMTGITQVNLRKMRADRRGLPFYKPTYKTVLYDRTEVDRYIRAQRVRVRGI